MEQLSKPFEQAATDQKQPIDSTPLEPIQKEDDQLSWESTAWKVTAKILDFIVEWSY